MNLVKHILESRRVTWVYISVFIANLTMWYWFGLIGMDLMYYITKAYIFMLFPIGLYMILSLNQNVYSSPAVIMRYESDSDKIFCYSTLFHTVLYSFALAFMSALMSFNIMNLDEVLEMIPVIIFIVIVYILFALLYLLLYFLEFKRTALIISICSMCALSIASYGYDFISIFFYNNTYLSIVIVAFCVVDFLLFLLLRKLMKVEKAYD